MKDTGVNNKTFYGRCIYILHAHSYENKEIRYKDNVTLLKGHDFQAKQRQRMRNPYANST